MTKEFKLLLNEGHFVYELLGLGYSQITNASFTSRGAYYQSFSALSNGIERLCKLIFVIDYYFDNCKFPDKKTIKNYGHNIEQLHLKALSMVVKYSIIFRNKSVKDKFVTDKIIGILNDFATYSDDNRYYNLNHLSTISTLQKPKDTIEKWYCEIDMFIFENKLTAKKRQEIETKAKLVDYLFQKNSFVYFDSETSNDIKTVESFAKESYIHHAVVTYRRVYVGQIIRELSEIICFLCEKAHKEMKKDIPFLGEMFGPFIHDDSYFKTTKKII